MSAQSPFDLLQTFLHRNPYVKYIRYTFIDYAAISRSRYHTVARALAAASALPEKTGSVSTYSPVLWAETVWGAWVEDPGEAGYEDHWVPDYTTIHVIPGEPEQAMVLCNIKSADKPSVDWYNYCPRSILRNVVAKAAEKHDLQFQVGFEVEFMLLPDPKAEGPVDPQPGFYPTAPLRKEHSKVLFDIVDALQAGGVGVWGFQPEDSWSQFEISLYPSDPLQAVDTLVFAIEAIRTIAAKEGYHVTLHPYPFEGGSTVGRHINVSACRASEQEEGAAHDERRYNDHFLAGLLKHMRPLSAFILAGYASWGGERETQSGRRAIFYGKHKCAPIRLTGASEDEKRWELRKPDCLGNPYLQIAAIITAGIQGVKDQLPLNQKLGPCVPNAPLSDEIRREIGVTEDLPWDLEEAIRCLKAQKELFTDWMGEACLRAYIKNKEMEIKVAGGLTSKERRVKIVAHI
ncbi:hypothetical protein I316_06418 [Kwoniella heveanensis BCC8398]|uniref:GS catalytic domain-containing protein n=1 Tax=Kwoniella heveanensis BCC8398 TaxID=1296120 RepID=A0A1B9GL73_9TREE|nr:hypothetical protein I316_06418 [Kwoniella heveanensis BCC8398]